MYNIEESLVTKNNGDEKMQSDPFLAWVRGELARRKWSNATMIREGGGLLGASAVSDILNGNMAVSLNFCNLVARAFDWPPEEVLRRAGLIEAQRDNDDPLLEEVRRIAAGLPENELRNAIRYLTILRQMNRENETGTQK